jgi:hypothetical protein
VLFRSDAFDGSPALFVARNAGWNQRDAAGDQGPMTFRVSGENGTEVGALPAAWRRAAPLAASPRPIAEDPVATIASTTGSVVPTVGASRRLDCNGAWVANRDPVDARLVQQYATNTGISTRVANEASVGGLPTLASGAACADADADGLPDAWETAHGLSSSTASDGNARRAGANGYTNLELYLSGMFPNGTALP